MICDLAAYRDRCLLPCHGLSEVGLTVCLMCSSFDSVYGLVGLLLRAIGLRIAILTRKSHLFAAFKADL